MNIADTLNTLNDMTTAELAAEYEGLFGKRPRYRALPWMRKRIAYRLQERAYGGLSRTALAELERHASEIEIPEAPTQRNVGDRGAKPLPKPGTTLRREWRGQQIEVEVLDDGFVWNDEKFGSLSAVARAVTGSRWNGRLFFGLTERKRS